MNWYQTGGRHIPLILCHKYNHFSPPRKYSCMFFFHYVA